MDSVLMIVLFIIVAVLSDKMGTKKKVPRKKIPVHTRPEFKIPDIKGAPVATKDNASGYLEQMAAAEASEHYQDELLTKAKELAYTQQRMAEEAQICLAEKHDYEIAAKLVAGENKTNTNTNTDIMVELNPQTARQAVVLAEVLGRPKAYQRFRH